MDTAQQALRELLKKNIPLHLILASEISQTPFGQITVNVTLVNGVAQIETINVVKNRRRKYQAAKESED